MGPVRQATQLAEIDPLDDPFGDAPQGNRDSHQHGFRDPSRLFSTANQEDAAEAIPAPAEAAPAPQAAPATPFTPEPQFTPEPLPLEPLYDESYCRDELADCDRSRNLFRDCGIKSISLDITPSFRSSTGGIKNKQAQLAGLESREYRGSDGQLLATGRLADFRNDHVHIKQADGKLAKIPFDKLSEADFCYVNSVWGLPAECVFARNDFEIRSWTLSTFTWKASALGHKPLYFEELQLERYGHTTGPLLQPWISGAHFFTNIAFLPYKMGINPLSECQYALGYYRPGNCAPWLVPPIPLSVRGGLMQAGAVVGLSALIP